METETKSELVAIMAKLDQLTTAEEHAGNFNAAESLTDIASRVEDLISRHEPIQPYQLPAAA
jgi:flagellar biosynthesis/type III secretory pathway chaperone